jgi:hypothetical protein
MSERPPSELGWYPVVPCCPHCYSSKHRRSSHPSGICVRCLGTLSPQRLALLEPLPDLLTPESWSLYRRSPERWLRLELGKGHICPAGTTKEAHRLMHLACARFWNGEDTPLMYELFEPPVPGEVAWAHTDDTSLDLDVFVRSEDSTELRAARERHNLHVRIWRNKFNTRIARPLFEWLHQLGCPDAATPLTIRREQKTGGGGGWVADLVLEALTPGRTPTHWVLMLSNEESDVVISMLGTGLTQPQVICRTVGDHLGCTVPYSRATLLDYLGITGG